jgi:hypothetical protein
MRSMLFGAFLIGGVAASIGAARAAAVAEDAFQVRSTGDLVTLCAADKTDPMYTAAQNFCHGFATGTFRTLRDVELAMRSKKKLFCETTMPAHRNEAIAAFVSWAQAHNDVMALPATDGILKFLEQQYPCS